MNLNSLVGKNALIQKIFYIKWLWISLFFTFSNSGACFFSFSIFHSFSQGLREDGGAVHEHLQSDPELTVSTV